MDSKHTVIGIDLGGTKISTALVGNDGEIIAHDYQQTRAAEGQEAVIERMSDAARRVMAQAGMDRSQVAAVGVGAPGPLDIEAGVVVAPPNLPGWDRVPLKQLIKDGLGITAFLENDANAAALGEHRFGAGRGVEHMIYITVSTGIGGGLILDGRLYHGADRDGRGGWSHHHRAKRAALWMREPGLSGIAGLRHRHRPPGARACGPWRAHADSRPDRGRS